MESSPKENLIYEWLKNDLDMPTYADVFLGAVFQLKKRPSGFVTFVSHAGRDIMNGVATSKIGIKREQTQYKGVLDEIQTDWPFDLQENRQVEVDGESGYLISRKCYKKLNKLIHEHQAGRVRSSDADDLFFQSFLDYPDKERIPLNFKNEWATTKAWFLAHTHLNGGSFSQVEMDECADRFGILENFLYIAASSQFERLKSFKIVLNNQDIVKVDILASIKKEVDRQYFFSRLKSSLWLVPLKDQEFFSSPPGVRHLPDGKVQFPYWPELFYLANIASEVPDAVVEILLSLPKTNNPSIYDGILGIALTLKGKDSVKLLPKIKEYAELETLFDGAQFPDLLKYWNAEEEVQKAIELVKILISFQEDPQEKEKAARRKENLEAYENSLKPRLHFRDYEYAQILKEGVRPLAEKQPLEISKILIDALSEMLCLEHYRKDREKHQSEDFSEIWCRRLDSTTDDAVSSREYLVEALVFACEKVFEAGENITQLDQILQNQSWKIFLRLRQYLFAKYPVAAVKESIRQLILEHEDYERFEVHFEFQKMIKVAVATFGQELLSPVEMTGIYQKIISGPSLQDYKEYRGSDYSDENFERKKRYFHRKQLQPFEKILAPEQSAYLRRLIDADPETQIKDEDYSPYGGDVCGTVISKSPKSLDDLLQLADEDLLEFINEWNNPHHEKDNWLVEINHSALAKEFQTVFKDSILTDSVRFKFWLDHRAQIVRPIYIGSILQAMKTRIQDKDFSNLAQWLDFCEWVLTHSDSDNRDREVRSSDVSSENPDWSDSRRAVEDLFEVCLKEESQISIDYRGKFFGLLKILCFQFDSDLDIERPVLLNQSDLISSVINSTRGRALQCLIKYALPEAPEEVVNVLNKRFLPDCEFPLTKPEYALLGMYFGNLLTLCKDWTIENKTKIFPLDHPEIRNVAFSAFLRYNRLQYNRPSSTLFPYLKDEYKNAAEEIAAPIGDKKNMIDHLGQHLIVLYLWNEFPLQGSDGLLELFYEKTNSDQMIWANLFEHIGYSLKNIKELNNAMTGQLFSFVQWRLDAHVADELYHFVSWLDADCLDAAWRLETYSAILDLEMPNNARFSLTLRYLNQLLPMHADKVLECFLKITQRVDQSSPFYISEKEVSPLLKAGFMSENEGVKKMAEDARENLLRLGRFEFMDMGQ
ncbi:MAG: hypothetical protein AUK31_02175 [Fibrobacteres bacterium CG2_30_45_31]|nr:MAG: hypothetical protein AUK31_02175 [Fibrobacteres bacterium CG2_30_45_31]